MLRYALVPLLALGMALSLASCQSRAEQQAMQSALDALDDSSDASYVLPTGTQIDPTVLYDQDGFQLTAQGVSMEDDGSLLLTVTAGNSTDHDLSLNGDYVTVNGWSVDALIDCSVSQGLAASGTIEIPADQLTAIGYTDLDTLGFHLYAYDEGTYDVVADLGDQSVSTGVSAPADGPDLSNAVVLYRDGDITVSCLNTGVWDGHNCEVTLYLQNDSGQAISLNNQDDVTVNGSTEVEGWVYEMVPPDCRRVGTVTMYCSDLEDAGIEADDISSLTTNLQLLDYDSYDLIADLGDVTLHVAGGIQTTDDGSGEDAETSDSSSSGDGETAGSDDDYSLPEQEPETALTTSSAA